MDYIYAVCRDKGGAHESMDVMSVWSTEKKANTEADRLDDPEIEVKKWALDVIGNVINW